MNNFKHTPGPWIIIDDVQAPLDGYRGNAKHIGSFNIKTQPDDNNPMGLWLSSVNPYECTGFIDKKTAMANAKLMAAAPDLLLALIDCVENILIDFPDDDQRKIKYYEVIKNATE